MAIRVSLITRVFSAHSRLSQEKASLALQAGLSVIRAGRTSFNLIVTELAGWLSFNIFHEAHEIASALQRFVIDDKIQCSLALITGEALFAQIASVAERNS